MPDRPRLTPAIADTRRAVRDALAELPADALVLVALSGGPDSLALAAATAFEAPRAGLRAGAVVVDHGLQPGSSAVAEDAAAAARELGLDPVLVQSVSVAGRGDADHDGPEAAARDARYAALAEAAASTGAAAVLLGHTLDDQAETVLLGLARGSGATSIRGMAAVSGPAGLHRRPLLGLPRAITVAACADAGLEPWIDPHNADPAYARVRVRQSVLPVLEAELGPGVAEALARTAAQAAEDADALDAMAREVAEDVVELEEAGVSLSVSALAANPAALRQRLIRLVADSEFHVALSRAQTLEIGRLVTDWHGQGPLDLPGFQASRAGGRIHLISTRAGELTGQKPPHDH
ncbi:tRNA lysidine(34) synthetase TilS [Schumannella sp. 10F1B-5-1]|uniref:tRNA lysidine(34) synthetase TilS n=1 Tax=Schumannella sp. 10F1B-5-1 TaxID=2590780 RepID=UPI001130F099|nr:tRNA lysidine(34) synthetase TilS [Schumannella sp. 10F1B-5-1]TPW71623.1 tRNA lysidine(34) synthetase TilS [Schumannella sp. 10F1B-5-1]